MQKPPKTLADYVVVAISPLLIMLLVGSLAFFLIQVFYRGAMIHGIRWLMFWFVLAIVLVSRISIEQGRGQARFYGAALAIVTWFYLGYTHGTVVLGAVLLAGTWWCAHRLTVDCTLIREDEDASGEGVLQSLWSVMEKSIAPPVPAPELPPLSPLELLAAADLARRRARQKPRPPGRTVVFFSLAALPLFGVGQLFLPADDPHARRIGFAFLAVYLSAALGLLATTSFLGLRRYLRQRSTEMPANVTFAWMQFGALLGLGVLLLALILPRPGANFTWKELTYRVETKPHQASDYALPFNPPGEGDGTPGDLPVDRSQRGVDSRITGSGTGSDNTRKESRAQSNPRGASDQPAQSDGTGGRSGSQGASGADGQADADTRASDNDRAPSGRTAKARGAAGSSGADQASDKDQPAGADGSGDRGRDRDGAGKQIANADPSQERGQEAKDSPPRQSIERKNSPAREKPASRPEPEQPANTIQSERHPSQLLARLLRALVVLALAVLLVWFLVRHRKVIADMVRSFLNAVRSFLRKLFAFRWRKAEPAAAIPALALVLEPFAAYENPFVAGKDKTWSPDRLLLYTYEAVGAWAKEQRIELRPQETPREFCCRLLERFPEIGPDLEQFSFDYTHIAFARRLPDDFETEPTRRLWQYLGDSVLTVAPR